MSMNQNFQVCFLSMIAPQVEQMKLGKIYN